MLFLRSFTARIIWSSCIAIADLLFRGNAGSLGRLRPPLRFIEVTHRTRDVAFGVAEFNQFANTGNHHLWHCDTAALLHDEPGDRIHVINAAMVHSKPTRRWPSSGRSCTA